MSMDYITPEFEVVRSESRCTACRICEKQCANGVHSYDESGKRMRSDEAKCVNCQRCVSFCPTHALKIVKNTCCFRENANWQSSTIKEIYKQASTGGVLLSSMGNPNPLPVYWDNLLINASQVTNPPIDPLREPMETRVFLGKKPSSVRRNADGTLCTRLPPQLELSVPILFSAMSYGSISYNAHASLARAARQLGIFYNTGEGGLHEDFYCYGDNTIVQVASGRFGVQEQYLNTGAAIEIKMGQGAKPGIGGHLPGAKITGDVSRTRMIPEGADAISPAPHHDIYSIEDLRQLVYSLKEATQYKKPVIVKVAAVHNIAAIASGIARSGADIIAIDGFRGGTGAAPTRIRDNVGIPIELALAAVDQRLRDEGIRSSVSLIVGGSIRSAADVVKAIALGADACYIATAALLAMGCHLCRTCQTGRCSWGIATQRPDLVQRLNPDEGAARLVNLITAWRHEIMEMMGGMGINSIEALRGNRVMLRGIHLTEKELAILGKGAGDPRNRPRRRMKSFLSRLFKHKRMEKLQEVWYNMDFIEADSLSFSELNETIRNAGRECRVCSCLGQRFIAAGMSDKKIEIDGIPGNALDAYLSGAEITVNGNAQDAVGDTMSAGRIVIRGSAGDAAGYAMRGGEIYIQGNAGYRAGIHMKAYQSHKPVIVIGGRAGSFLGEYQAGGLILVLALHTDRRPVVGFFPCTGMHGGKMVFRGDVSNIPFPEQVTSRPATEEDRAEFAPYVREYCRLFGCDAESMLKEPYTVITPDSKNPYQQMYVAN